MLPGSEHSSSASWGSSSSDSVTVTPPTSTKSCSSPSSSSSLISRTTPRHFPSTTTSCPWWWEKLRTWFWRWRSVKFKNKIRKLGNFRRVPAVQHFKKRLINKFSVKSHEKENFSQTNLSIFLLKNPVMKYRWSLTLLEFAIILSSNSFWSKGEGAVSIWV